MERLPAAPLLTRSAASVAASSSARISSTRTSWNCGWFSRSGAVDARELLSR
jgi:hypothetical protein